jgi:hypothetical protein
LEEASAEAGSTTIWPVAVAPAAKRPPAKPAAARRERTERRTKVVFPIDMIISKGLTAEHLASRGRRTRGCGGREELANRT